MLRKSSCPFFVLIVTAILCGGCHGRFTERVRPDEGGSYENVEIEGTEGDDDDEGAEKSVEMSPKCAAVLLSGGVLGGAGLAYAVAPVALCTAGFCPVGVSGASFASWWQSTIILVQSGSLFSVLQSVAMGGVGTKVALAGGVLGGEVSMRYLEELCAYVDDPNSSVAPVFDTTLEAVRGAALAADKARAVCAASETCTAAADLAQTASATVSSSLSSVWGYISDSVDQAVETISNKNEAWHLEKDILSLTEQMNGLKENTYSGRAFEQARDLWWSRGMLDWASGGTIEAILILEKEIKEKEAELKELQQNND